MSERLLEVQGISKAFPGVQALADVEFHLDKGEVLALVGENGAGKSTLMKILSGIYTRDTGTIWVDGKEEPITSPSEAQELGIAIIYQEMNLMPHLTVAQNIYIGREPRTAGGFGLNERALNKKAAEHLDRLGIALSPTTIVGTLTVAKQQMVEIAKALSFDSRVLIMDEPTSALTAAETETLFKLINDLRDRGTGIIYISHRMEELGRIADRVSVLRDGRYVGSLGKGEFDVPKIIEMMVGRHIDEDARPEISGRLDTETVLEVKGLYTRDLIRDASFDIRKGEILGFAGLMGAGRTELARAIFGADPTSGGEVLVKGQPVSITRPVDAVRHGIGYLSEDRKVLGLLLQKPVDENIVLASLSSYRNQFGFMQPGKARVRAEEFVRSLRIKTPHVRQLTKNLSGGNQQKVVLAKWLERDCDILIVDEPTRGIDVGAKAEIYDLLNRLAAEGKAIIVISSELPEVLRISHRIAVMSQGRITGFLDNSEATQPKIMALATKGHDESYLHTSTDQQQ
ncbi:MAG: sugar ABC transporter ATP-binding protein [Propionicimonas sp.]